MRLSGEKKPPPPPANAATGQLQKPTRGPANTEAFGRFVRNLSRLEGGAGRLGKAGDKKRAEGTR